MYVLKGHLINMKSLPKRNKYYAHATGGLGDHFTQYFGKHIGHPDLSYITAMKKHDPNCIIKLISHTAIPIAIKNFFRFHPLIDVIKTLPWRNPTDNKCSSVEEHNEAGKGFVKITTAAKQLKLKREKQLDIYTTKEDDRRIKEVTDQGKFVLLHPFSTDIGRISLSKKYYKILVQEIIDNFGCNVVIVGRSHKKQRTHITIKRQEIFDFDGDNVINLVNKSNIRVSAKLAFHSECVVANNSIYNCLLSGGTIPLILLRPRKGSMFNMKRLFWTTDHVRAIDTSVGHDIAVRQIIKDLNCRIFKQNNK